MKSTEGEAVATVRRMQHWHINTYLFFTCILIFEVLVTLQGIDLLDEGFHASLYQQFFNDPNSVQYAFVYWFSGFIGGGIIKIFPSFGLLGLRLAGAFVSTLTVLIAYKILRKHLNDTVLKISLAILVLFISNDPKDLYYNNLSAFLYVVAAYFLFKGLINKNGLFIFLGGLITGLNIFTRLPNILGIGLGLVIIYAGIIYSDPFKTQIRKLLFYILGVATSVAGVILLMYHIGHLPVFINSIKVIFQVSNTATKNDGSEGSYGLISLVSLCGMQYFVSFISVIILVFFVFCWSFLKERIKIFPRILIVLIKLAILFPAAIFTVLIIRNGINNYKLIYFVTGLSLIASILVMLFDESRERKLIAFTGCFIMLVHPFGSAVGIFTVIPYSMWLSFPFVVDFLFNTEALHVNFSVNNGNSNTRLALDLDKTYLNNVKTGVLTVIVMTSLFQVIKYPYFYDTHSRFDMIYSVHNKFMKGIYTSKAKAKAINELLEESTKYVKPNDYVLAYDLIPMYHYWTETKSYVRNPCPWFYSSTMFSKELDLAESDSTKPLPVVVMQKIKTFGFNNGKWPEFVPDGDYENWERNKGRNKILGEFLQRHNYKTVWSNSVFKILIPG
jgi:hypothetical protein